MVTKPQSIRQSASNHQTHTPRVCTRCSPFTRVPFADVLVMRDVACAGYVAGCNTRWFAKGEDNSYSASNAADAIQARLSFAHDDTDRYASMLAFPCWEGQFNSGQLDTVMSVTTRLLPWEVNNAGLHASFPGGDDMYRVYNAELQLSQVHYGEVRLDATRTGPPVACSSHALPCAACAGHEGRWFATPPPQTHPLAPATLACSCHDVC